VVFFCGFRSDMSGIKAETLDQLCASRGQAFLRFDYRGHGASSGRFEDGTIGTWLADSLAAIDALTAGPQIFVGSSMGGWIALLAARERPARVAGLVTVACAADFTERLIWDRLPPAERERIVADGLLRAPSAYDPAGYVITHALIEEARRHLVLDGPIPLDMPARLLHGLADRDVPWRQSLAVAEALTGADVRVVLIKGGGHRLSEPAQLELLADAVAELSDLRPATP
jgi:pimeloyl-ACP methyl ester carboxylesterase